MNNMYDIIIAGAGPSGSIAAITYKKRNPQSKILVFDKQKFPRHKIGEVILPGSIEILKHLNCFNVIKEKNFLRKVGVKFFWGNSIDTGFIIPSNNIIELDGTFQDTTPEIYSYHVDRAEYDMALIDHMKSLGVDFIDGAILQKVNWKDELHDEIYSIQLDDQEFRSKYYIDAAGVSGALVPRSQKQLTSYDFSGDVCYHCYIKAENKFTFKGLPNYTETIISAHGNQCWSFFIPLSKDTISVGIVFKSKYNPELLNGFDLEDIIFSKMSQNKELKETLEKAKIIQSYRGLPTVSVVRNWNTFSQRLYGKNWILAGDSAFFSDPILSAGVTMAQKTGFYAALVLSNINGASDNKKQLYFKTYEQYCYDFFGEVHKIIEFWYKGMDKSMDISKLFSTGEEILRGYGYIENTDSTNSFSYLINGFLGTTNENVSIGSYEDLDYRIFIRGLTGLDVEIITDDISSETEYSLSCEYLLTKRLKLIGFEFILSPYLIIKNTYNTRMFISEKVRDFILHLSMQKPSKDFFEYVDTDIYDTFLKDLKRLELLGLISKKV